MRDIEIIQEDAAKLQLLEELKNNQLPVQITLLSGDFNGMSYVNGIRQRRSAAFFRIESVQSLATAIDRGKGWKGRFEFYGKDNIQYVFRTTGWKTGSDGIWHHFPEFIERRQRRKHFRLEIPQQMDLFLILGSARHKMRAIDISISGIFVEFMASGQMTDTDGPWQVGEPVKELVLETESDGASYLINIQEGVLRRSERESSSGKYKYAFEFTKMAKSEETALVDFVYELQRKILKERINKDT